MKPIFTEEEVRAIAHLIGNSLCNPDIPDRAILLLIREKIRAYLEYEAQQKAGIR